MRTPRLAVFLATAFGLGALSTTSLAQVAPRPAPAAHDQSGTAASGEVASAQWSDVKDTTYEMRAQIFAGLKRLEAKLDLQVRELVAKRATMKGITDTREWDFAMKQMEAACSYFKSVGAELGKATRETWDQEKDKVGRAWVSTQEAYAKVKSSTTT